MIIPEQKVVLIMPPRTGSRALAMAVKARYPSAMWLYSHREADGVPAGYDRWERIGVLRDPVDRLRSLYRYIRNGISLTKHDPKWLAAHKKAVEQPFSDWVVNNEILFCDPYGRQGEYTTFRPFYSVSVPLPENRKSQFHYLRPDLGTTIYSFDSIEVLASDLDVSLERTNHSEPEDGLALEGFAQAHINRWFAWDIEMRAFMSRERPIYISGGDAMREMWNIGIGNPPLSGRF